MFVVSLRSILQTIIAYTSCNKIKVISFLINDFCQTYTAKIAVRNGTINFWQKVRYNSEVCIFFVLVLYGDLLKTFY